MSSPYPERALKSLTVKIGSGATPRGGAAVYTDSGVAFIRSQNVLDFRFDATGLVRLTSAAAHDLRGVAVERSDVLVNITGDSVARVCLAPDLDARVSQHVAIVRANPLVLDPRFLLYWLLTPATKGRLLTIAAGGATRKALTKADLESLRIPTPSLVEQRRVAEVLGAFDELIEGNRALISTALELMKSLFRRLMEHSSPERLPLLDAFDVDFGSAFKGAHFTKAGVGHPLIRIRDLKTFRPDTWTSERIPGDVLVQPGDVVVGMDAEFRPTYWLGEPGLLNQRVCRVRPKRGSRSFVREALVAPMAFIEGHKTGTTVSHLNKADLAETKIDVPSVVELAEYDAVAEPLRMLVVGLHQENRELAAARDELLPLLMSGRIAVGDVAA